MTDTQVQYASVIHSSGKELLELLNSILDLAKAESGTVTVEMSDLPIAELRAGLLREFEHVAPGKGLDFSIELGRDCPAAIVTDPQRLRQILKNLLANAFKFTEHGEVRVQVGLADRGWSRDDGIARHAHRRSSPFSVTRHRHRHRRRAAAANLRSVRAG